MREKSIKQTENEHKRQKISIEDEHQEKFTKPPQFKKKIDITDC